MFDFFIEPKNYSQKRFPDVFLVVLLTCFAANPAAQAEIVLQVLYNFQSSGQGPRTPFAGLVQGYDGNFYGTTRNGGSSNLGTVYVIRPAGTLTLLASFNNTNGSYPRSCLVPGRDGSFYGTTPNGGAGYNGVTDSGNGAVFQIASNSALNALVSFYGTNGSRPFAGLAQGSDGNLYGVTAYGGRSSDGKPFSGNGTIFRITPDGAFTNLVSFNGTNGTYPDGSLVQGNDGNFYGTTAGGGSNYHGTVFQITPAGALMTLFAFNGTNGSFPYTELVQARDGDFYGTTYQGGLNDLGTVFRIRTNGTFTTLISFSGPNGSHPFAGLVEGDGGELFGTTYQGGTSNLGTIFKYSPDGTLTTLVSFKGTNGSAPQASLVRGSDGNFYGTTSVGGTYGGGTIFRLVKRPIITAIVQSTNSVTITWTSFTNGIYRVEYKASLTVGNWTSLVPNVTASVETKSFTDTIGATTQRYYRIALLP